MSMTITIERNVEYCKQHGMERYQHDECMCTDKLAGISPTKECPYCEGKGTVARPVYPFVLDLSSRNFGTLWSALGLQANEYGSIDARQLRSAMATVGSEMVERETTSGFSEGGASWMDFGIKPEQAERYFNSLDIMCDEAERREERIYWC